VDCESLRSGESGPDIGLQSFLIISRLHGLAADEGGAEIRVQWVSFYDTTLTTRRTASWE
jgi:hypothetical protein